MTKTAPIDGGLSENNCPPNDDFHADQVPDFSTPEALASFTHNSNTILGAADTSIALGNLSLTDKRYNADKIRAINRFYSTLTLHPQLDKLAEKVTDPEQVDGQRVTRLVLLTRGVKKNSKLQILNACMMFFSQNYRMRSSNKVLD